MKTGKWSDRDQWVQETAGASDVSEEVMTGAQIALFTAYSSDRQIFILPVKITFI